MGFAALLLLNGVGFAVAAADKRRAGRGGRRVAERTFHGLALCGAWPGIVVAFLLLRHKTRKTRFLVPFACAVLVNVALVVILYRLATQR